VILSALLGTKKGVGGGGGGGEEAV